MPSGLSEVAIFNMAFDLLDEEVAVSPDDDRAAVRWMKRNFGPTRDALLELHPWDFALGRVILPAMSEAPAFGWQRAFAEPADCIRILPLTGDGELDGAPVPHEVEGGAILTDAPAPLKVRYIRRITNPGLFSPLFAEALAARLAAKGAMWMTGKQSYVERLEVTQEKLLRQARLAMALTGTAPRPVAEDWIDARR
jgi:hypothetical protein